MVGLAVVVVGFGVVVVLVVDVVVGRAVVVDVVDVEVVVDVVDVVEVVELVVGVVDVVDVVLLVVVGGAEAWAWAGTTIELTSGFVHLPGRTMAVATPPMTIFRTWRRS